MLFLVILFDGTIFRIGSFYYKVASFNWASFHSISELILMSAKGGFNDRFRGTLNSLTGAHETCSFQKKEIVSSFYNIAFLLGQLPFPMIIKNAFLFLVEHNLGMPPDQYSCCSVYDCIKQNNMQRYHTFMALSWKVTLKY